MCGPAALAPLLIASTVVSTIGAGFSALQANAQGKYQAKIADRNADMARESERSAQDATKQEAAAHYRQMAQLKGQQRVAMAAGGIDLNFGSAADLQADTQLQGNEDLNRIYESGSQRARSFDIEAANFGATAQARRQAASGALVSGVFNMGATALGGATQYAKLVPRI
ncbi:hypothetical protein BH10PSE12_BH10PSE12_16580 [soil metagenome]